MAIIETVQDVEVVKVGDRISLRFSFNGEEWRALEIKQSITAEELGKNLIHFGQRIIHEAGLKKE